MPNRIASQATPAALVLADGTTFHGQSFGAPGFATGEVVFHTGMTGYQEILTDPSYCRQLVTLTSPQIGNTGINSEDMESDRIHAEGLIIKALPQMVSNWRSQRGLGAFLQAEGKVGLAGIDTRRLTRLLRERGAQAGCVVAQAQPDQALDLVEAQRRAAAFAGLAGMDLAKEVSATAPYVWRSGVWRLETGFQDVVLPAQPLRVVAYDFGIKRNILRLLAELGAEVHVVPATTPSSAVLALNPDGVFLSNGPGDPEPCRYAIEATRDVLNRKIPVFGICLGLQILALACGARTLKMKFGHHGANHPVLDLDSGRVMISSQNHGFAVDPDSLPADLRVTHRSLFDQSIQGIEHTARLAFGFQGHPEASPGPHDLRPLFERFATLMRARRA